MTDPSEEITRPISRPVAAAPLRIAGRWAVLWPRAGWGPLHSAAIAADLAGLGFDGVSIHDGLASPADALAHVDAAHTRRAVFEAAGLRVAVGLGFPKPRPDDLDDVARGIAAAVAGGFDHVQLDWEGSWDGHRADARTVLDLLADLHPEWWPGSALTPPRKPSSYARTLAAMEADGSWRLPCPVTSLCWWAWKTLPSGGGTHPSSPTPEFLSLTAPDVPVCPQTYNDGKRDGEASWQIAWSRRQYAPRPVVPTIQGYAHSVADRVALLRAEPTVVVWDYLELDAPFRAACAVAWQR